MRDARGSGDGKAGILPECLRQSPYKYETGRESVRICATVQKTPLPSHVSGFVGKHARTIQ